MSNEQWSSIVHQTIHPLASTLERADNLEVGSWVPPSALVRRGLGVAADNNRLPAGAAVARAGPTVDLVLPEYKAVLGGARNDRSGDDLVLGVGLVTWRLSICTIEGGL